MCSWIDRVDECEVFFRFIMLVVISHNLPFILIPLSYGSYVPTIRFILRLQAAVASNSRSKSLSCTSRRQHYQPQVNSSSTCSSPPPLLLFRCIYTTGLCRCLPLSASSTTNPSNSSRSSFLRLEIHTTRGSLEAPDIMVGVERIVDMLRVTPVLWKG